MEKKILAGLVLAWPVAAWAGDGPDLKPGLWEVTSTVTVEVEMNAKAAKAAKAMPPLTEAQLAALPPKERAEAEARMRGHKIVVSPRIVVTKTCKTGGPWAGAVAPGPPGSLSCKDTVSATSGAGSGITWIARAWSRNRMEKGSSPSSPLIMWWSEWTPNI